MKIPYLSKNDTYAVRDFYNRIFKLLGDGVERVALFGSKMEGGGTAESDIDIFILLRDSAKNMKDQILDEAFEVNLKYGVYISPRIIMRSIYYHPIWKKTPFLQRLEKEAISLPL